jgi:hypothetical protein
MKPYLYKTYAHRTCMTGGNSEVDRGGDLSLSAGNEPSLPKLAGVSAERHGDGIEFDRDRFFRQCESSCQ